MDDVMSDLETPSGFLVSGATNINDFGQVAGYAMGDYQSQYAYLWEEGNWTYIGTLPDLDYSSAFDINNAGQTVGYSFILGPGGGTRGWIYEDGEMTDLGALGGNRSTAYAINELGQVVGWAEIDEPGISHAFLWEAGEMTDLGVLPNETDSSAADINENGQVCGLCAHTIPEYPFPTYRTACLWDNESIINIGKLPGYARNSGAGGINNLGQVVGFSSNNANQLHAFLWEDGVLTDLNDLLPPGSGWELMGAADINDEGVIVGYGDYNGETRAYLLAPITLNQPPVFSNEIPADGATGVPVTTTSLSVMINDPEGDSFNWSIETSPYIGNSSGTGDYNGTKTCSVSGLNYDTTYTWFVNATNNGYIWTRAVYTFTTEEVPIPDLDCEGSLSWSEVEPGTIVTGEFDIENNGDPESLLTWEITEYPEWGEWSFDPMSGTDLPAGTSVTVDVEVVAPEEENTEFEGEIKVVNSENSSDSCTIDVYLKTPCESPYMQLLEFIMMRFPILELILNLFL
jgi:probable HAF family extracellular repeat protein